MKLFRFVKKVFFLGLTILSNFTNALDCISIKNQNVRSDQKLLILIVIILYFTLLVLK